MNIYIRHLRILLVVLLFAGSNEALADTTCDIQQMDQYFSRFTESVPLQKQSTAASIQWTDLQRTGDDLKPSPRTMAADILPYPLVPGAAQRDEKKIRVSIYDGYRVIVMDDLAKYFRTYEFSQKDCMTLIAIEVWWVSDDQLVVDGEENISEKGKHCLSRGDYLSALAGPEEHWALMQMFEAAERNYLCAAKEGSRQGAFSAVSLSASGMAPEIERKEFVRLLEFAAENDARASALLASFYCDGGSASWQGECLNPKKAEAALIKAIHLGSVSSINTFGSILENGDYGSVDFARAASCYHLAAKKGDALGKENYERLKEKGLTAANPVSCF